jgi:hypothetical protein
MLLAGPPPARAQSSRVALDVVAAVDGNAGSHVVREATGWFDVFGAVQLADNLHLRARPVVFRRSFNGTWTTQMYELALRSILENRPDRNPVVSPHSTLYLPVPRYEAGTPTTFLLAASYPLGAKVTLSGGRGGKTPGQKKK